MAKKIKKNKKSSDITINRERILSSLKKVYLGGAIGECLLVVKKGVATCEVVDITNSIVVLEKGRIGSKSLSGQFGLGNIEVMIKFLASVPDDKLIVATEDTGRMIITGKNKRRSLDYLTTLPNLIATRLRMDSSDKTDYVKEFQKMTDIAVTVPSDFIKDFNSYLSVLKSKIVTFDINDERCMVTLGASTEHQFQLRIPEEYIENDDEEEIIVQTNGENLSRVFSVMETNDDESPTMSIGEDNPIVVEDGSTMWALTPFKDDSAGEDD